MFKMACGFIAQAELHVHVVPIWDGINTYEVFQTGWCKGAV